MKSTAASASVKTAAGCVSGRSEWRKSLPEHGSRDYEVIVGESPCGSWSAQLGHSGRHRYRYPRGSTSSNDAAIRRVVAKILAKEWA